MKYFMDDYFSVDKFKKAYARFVEPLGDRATWLKVFFASEVGTPILKRVIRQQRKNRIKGCREGRNSKKATATGTEKAKKIICGKFKCPTYHQLVIGKNSPKCPLMGPKKRQVFYIIPFFHTWHIANSFNVVQEKEVEKKIP
jgi:hypothetical protein